ncbi:hypothetical protein N7456_011289 [Penicillium angulare]|uniref:Uncharacterized protein n=1 Tax=Penicillium angulare TaxID=116970 RepID=A0A9W9JZQ5_9EURO|nr:hypothetical protein N7456_011289 [Penicillium angulare]
MATGKLHILNVHHAWSTALSPFMAFSWTEMAANTVRTIALLPAFWVIQYPSSIFYCRKTLVARRSTVVTTGKNGITWLGAMIGIRAHILEAGSLTDVATFWNSLFDFDFAFEVFQVKLLIALDSFLDMATGKFHILNVHHARATNLTAKSGAFVFAS